jgi:hypothetical protein
VLSDRPPPHLFGHSGLDYRILVEADFLVNIYEDGIGRRRSPRPAEIFRTATGARFLDQMYG